MKTLDIVPHTASQKSVSRGAVQATFAGAKDRMLYFIVTILGFSFWFFTAVPFASHRESYWWLGMVHTEGFAKSVAVGISSTFRPLAQLTTWTGFWLLNPGIFPTSALRQALLQGSVYALFVLAWWLIYRSAVHNRTFGILGLITGGVFFSGYIQLFHLYGVFYAAVMLMLGSILYFHSTGDFLRKELWLGAVAVLLSLWHPFSTALFLGFYFGFYIDSFRQRSLRQHLQAVSIFLSGTLAIFVLVVLFPRNKAVTMHERLFGFLVSYQANEVSRIASVVAYLLTLAVITSMEISRAKKLMACVLATVVAAAFMAKGIPVLMIFVLAALLKLLLSRSWALFFLMLAAVALPLGGGLGGPMYVLFAIIMAILATARGWTRAEEALRVIKPGFAIAAIVLALSIMLAMRVGVRVPVVSSAAKPLLRERERTYQLEQMLAWLHKSEFCNYNIQFVENAGNPVDSVQSALQRQHRPPSDINDVSLFWERVLRCKNNSGNRLSGSAVFAFDEPELAGSRPVYSVPGKYAGNAVIWVRDFSTK